MPPSFFSLKLLILHIFHPYSGGGGRACAATASCAAIGMKDSYEEVPGCIHQQPLATWC
jgi:hypothetical protein